MKLLIARILFNLELNTVPRTVYTMNWNIKACKQMEVECTLFFYLSETLSMLYVNLLRLAACTLFKIGILQMKTGGSLFNGSSFTAGAVY